MGNIKLFENKEIRAVWNETEEQWYFSIQDVVQVLTDAADIKDYIKKIKKRDPQLNSNWGTICPPVEMKAADGKKRKIQAANIQGLLRIIQSVPSPKAEPFKQWMAKAKGLKENANAGKKGGSIAKHARKELESKTGKNVVTGENFLPPQKENKKLKD